MHVNGNDIGRFRLAKAVAPCEFKTATHATSCNTFKVAKNLDPYLPNVDEVISIAFSRMDAPMYPTKKRSIPPNMWPRISGNHSEDSDVVAPIPIPASISETEIATPNQIIAFDKSPVRFSILFPL